MKLQLLVCQYDEPESIIGAFLESVALQVGCDLSNDIGVIICNDGGNTTLSEEYLRKFPYNIEYYLEPHRGLYATRNVCLDRATADFVMFCDADDRFYSVMGIYDILQKIEENTDIDYINSAFVEETVIRETNRVAYVIHDEDCRFVHGKVYRRQFLIENNIRYNGDLKVHGDSFFLVIADRMSQKSGYIKQPFYLWKWRDDSICRKNKDHMLITYNCMVDVVDAIIDEALRRGLKDTAFNQASKLMYGTYYKANSDDWLDPQNKAYVDKIDRRMKAFLDKNIELITTIPDEIEHRIITNSKKASISIGVLIEHFTLAEWVERIKAIT